MMRSLIIEFAVLRGLVLWPGMSTAAFVISCLWYVGHKIAIGRSQGKSWRDVLADGTKPLTGSIWLDAALFIAVLAGDS